MNELCNTTSSTAKIRKTLLATASAFVLAAYTSLPETALADSDDRPTVWIEGGWQFESVSGKSDFLVPPLDASTKSNGLPSFTAIESALGRTYGGEGSISFQPKGSDWVFTASARYGRVQTARHVINEKTIVGEQMLQATLAGNNFPFTPTFGAYADGVASNREAHAIADFQVGKDVGIGLFGRGTDSIISVGARYAQMNAKSKAHQYANPGAKFEQFYLSIPGHKKYNIRTTTYRSAAFVERSDNLHVLGPSLSLKNSTGLLGSIDGGRLAVDWGVNVSVLFGRQKAQTSHHSSVKHTYGFRGGANHPPVTNVYPLVARSRSRMVTVPNVGGFASLSYRFPNAKLSAGYRADFFFGARDSGLETRNTTDVGFHGPFATISIGLGG